MKVDFSYYAYVAYGRNGEYRTIEIDYLQFISCLVYYEFSHIESDIVFFKKKKSPLGKVAKMADLLFIKAEIKCE